MNVHKFLDDVSILVTAMVSAKQKFFSHSIASPWCCQKAKLIGSDSF